MVVVVLENMAGQKNVVGSKFEDLRDIIDLVEDKDRVRSYGKKQFASWQEAAKRFRQSDIYA